MLTYLDAILRVYNLFGRRDNMFKARIKILVKALGAEEFARQVEEEWAHLADGPSTLTDEELHRVTACFKRRHAGLDALRDAATASHEAATGASRAGSSAMCFAHRRCPATRPSRCR